MPREEHQKISKVYEDQKNPEASCIFALDFCTLREPGNRYNKAFRISPTQMQSEILEFIHNVHQSYKIYSSGSTYVTLKCDSFSYLSIFWFSMQLFPNRNQLENIFLQPYQPTLLEAVEF